MVKTNRLKHPSFGFSLSSIAQPVTVVDALYVSLGKRTKLHNKYFGYCFIPYHISSTPQAFCFLKCSLLARKICQMLVLAKINTVLACSQMLAKTILYPSLLVFSSSFRFEDTQMRIGVFHRTHRTGQTMTRYPAGHFESKARLTVTLDFVDCVSNRKLACVKLQINSD